jgi:predicted transcriptional regulator
MVTETRNQKTDETEKILHVRVVGTVDEDPVAEAMRALDEGDEPDYSYGLTLETEAQINEVLDDKNLELIRTVAREDVESIRDLARRLDRDVRQVHDAVTVLETLGLVELEDEGKRKRPKVWYDSITVDIPVAV